jgi:DNA-binding transcriptional MerR regulator
MKIGEVARRADVSVKTVRHYESLGLVSSTRLSNGYRDYAEDAPRMVAEAHALSHAGIRLEQTRPFLDCLAAGSENADDCVATRPAYRVAIQELTERIGELERRRAALAALLEAAEARHDPGCALLGTAREQGHDEPRMQKPRASEGIQA